MTYITDRDALAWALYRLEWPDAPAKPTAAWLAQPTEDSVAKQKADALIASGAVVDAATLADAEALVEAADETYTYERWRGASESHAMRRALRALAAALTERGA